MAVQLAALGFKATHQSIELARQPQVRPDRRSLHGARARDEDLEIVHPSEQVLRFLEGTDGGHRPRAAQVADQFHPIPQLLHRDAHVVQTVGQVDPGGVVDRGAQPRRSPRCALARRREPLRIAHASPRGCDRQFPRCRNGALSQLVEIGRLDAPAHLGMEELPFVPDDLAEPDDGGTRHVALAFEFVEVDQGDIELADGAKRPREPLYDTLEFATARATGDER